MKKLLILLAFSVFLIPGILAINLLVEEKSSDNVIIQGLNEPVIFNLDITNRGESDNFQFYNLLGFSMAPKGTVYISNNQKKNVQIIIYPRQNFDTRGFYNFKYFIRSEDSTEQAEKLTIKIVNLEDVFEIGADSLDPESNSMEVYIHNKEGFNFENLKVNFNSVFFNFEESFQLGKNERKTFNIKLKKEDFEKLFAGFYTLTTKINVNGLEAEVEGVIKFSEKDILTTTETNSGIIINTQITKKRNEGNVPILSETSVKKNIVSRLFTSLSPEPDVVNRKGFSVYYTWSDEIKPGENVMISVKTNWTIPLLLIIFVVIIVAFTRIYSRRDVTLNKKVTFVKTKGGEFALKVSIIVHAKKYVERVNIIDKLPSLVKIYEKFGIEKPSKVDERARRIEWDLDKLEAGEARVLSYIIYSKVGIVGKFALPEVRAIYEHEGKIHESSSNKVFFIAEQKRGEVEEEY